MSINIHLRPNYSTHIPLVQCQYFEFQSIFSKNTPDQFMTSAMFAGPGYLHCTLATAFYASASSSFSNNVLSYLSRMIVCIISRVPDDLVTLYTQFMSGKKLAKAGLAGIIILAILLVVIVFVIILQDGERRIAVQYSKKVQGRKTYGGQSSHIPLKVNTAGVIPVIFSSSLMQTPIVIAQFLGKGNGTGIGSKILAGLNSNNWCDPENPIYSIGLVVYILLTIFFAYFYTSITFNPMEIANNMKKSGGFIPGIRPGKPTVDYLTKILNYIIFVGACGLIIVQVIPYFFNGVFGANVSFGGTSLIIIVGVVLETIKKIESQMLVRNYTGFLNNKGSNMKNSYLGY